MSINYGGMTEEELIAPEYYFSGRKGIRSDLPWIKSQLILLNIDQKRFVCAEYREVYLKQGRREANVYLKNYVDEHGSGSNVKASAFANGEIPRALQERIERIRKSQSRPSIIDMAENK